MNQINVDAILRVNGYHGGGYIPAADREAVADAFHALEAERARLTRRRQKKARRLLTRPALPTLQTARRI